jgi:SAM-dependent methyltransferase
MARKQHVPWNAAGTASEEHASADEVVRRTGWVFNNVIGSALSLAEFVESGDDEVAAYTAAFGLAPTGDAPTTLVEIGAGIGRMTAGFTRMYSRVIACDLDGAFLERCRETVAQFGNPGRLNTVHVADGRTLEIDDGVADITFSYITFQHCHAGDAVALSAEAVRVTKPGGIVALNYRTWVGRDVVLWPAGAAMRGLWRVPVLGKALARNRTATRIGWQANRLSPPSVLARVADDLTDIRIFRAPVRPPFEVPATTDAEHGRINPSHWWLVARREP